MDGLLGLRSTPAGSCLRQESVTALNLSGTGLRDLEDLLPFVQLKSLKLANNALGDLPVRRDQSWDRAAEPASQA